MNRLLWIMAVATLMLPRALTFAADPAYFEIRVTDKQTGRGVPMVVLETVDHTRYVTDNAGRIAYREPGQAGETVFFHVHPQGYRVPKDGFGIAGVRLKIEPGGSVEIALERVNVAERLYRITGQGLYRDSVLLGHDTPLENPLGSGKVAGQDSVQVVRHRKKLHWFWGDTGRLSYPLGNFRMSGATTELPGQGGPDPSEGIDLRYFTGEDGFSRPMAHLDDPKGVLWLDGFSVVPDRDGKERLAAHYSHRPGLAEEFGHGMMLYDDGRERFEPVTELPLSDRWRFVQHHPSRVRIGDTAYLQFGGPFPVTRVPATLEAVLDPAEYESWSCIAPDAEPKTAEPLRTDDGELDWRWRKGPPVTQNEERRWLKAGLIKPDEARYLPADGDRRVLMHHGSVFWNEHRERWVMIATEYATERDSPSFLGEVWYSEAESPQGPWRKAVRVVSHDKQSFYNPCHHPFFDEDGGRVIYFEGTYCNTFTESPPTPRYNYNQMMYRLDLDHPELVGAFPRD